MPSTINLKRKIRSIKNTSQITKAMELVAASKLKRAQELALKSRDYYLLANDLSWRLSQKTETKNQPLFRVAKIKKKMYLILTSDSGLAGAFNANIIKELTLNLVNDQNNNIDSDVVAIGKKGAQFVGHLKNNKLEAVYNEFKDQPSVNDLKPLLNTVINSFKDQKVDQINLIYTSFISTISQKVINKQILPIAQNNIDNSDSESSLSLTNFEPDIETVIDQIATRLIEAELWQAVLDSKASEYAMRMLAMKNATDNAKDLIDEYTLELNTVRQASITQELAEISGGVEALKE